jgi:hypothetical protein
VSGSISCALALRSSQLGSAPPLDDTPPRTLQGPATARVSKWYARMGGGRGAGGSRLAEGVSRTYDKKHEQRARPHTGHKTQDAHACLAGWLAAHLSVGMAR